MRATAADAKAAWESLGDKATPKRAMAKLRAAGLTIAVRTFARWRKNGWVRDGDGYVADEVITARVTLEDIAPVVTGDPGTTVEDVVKNSPLAKALAGLPYDELLEAAAKGVLIAVPCFLEAALQKAEAIVSAQPQAAGTLVNACAQALESAGNGVLKADELRARRAMTLGQHNAANGNGHSHPHGFEDVIEAYKRGEAA